MRKNMYYVSVLKCINIYFMASRKSRSCSLCTRRKCVIHSCGKRSINANQIKLVAGVVQISYIIAPLFVYRLSHLLRGRCFKSPTMIVGFNTSLISISFCFMYIKGLLLSADTMFGCWINLFVLIIRTLGKSLFTSCWQSLPCHLLCLILK